VSRAAESWGGLAIAIVASSSAQNESGKKRRGKQSTSHSKAVAGQEILTGFQELA